MSNRARELYRNLVNAIAVLEECRDLIAQQQREIKALRGADDPQLRTLDCRSCGAPISFVKVPDGSKSIPVNPGLLTVVTADGRTVKGRVSHFATCPKADQHRSKNR
jgi:hypothetical protein